MDAISPKTCERKGNHVSRKQEWAWQMDLISA